MARKRTEIKAIRSNVPIYPIGVAARLLNVHPRTLRIYEQEGLVKPTIIGTRRMYSADDIQWITCLRTFIHEEGISIPGLKKLLDYVPCWEVADCPANIHERCSARVDWTRPRKPYPVGDAVAAQKAREEDRRTQETAAGEKKKRGSSTWACIGRTSGRSGPTSRWRSRAAADWWGAVPPLRRLQAGRRRVKHGCTNTKGVPGNRGAFCVSAGQGAPAAQASSPSSSRGLTRP